ncbi:MAG: tRNA (5-methylaminomethyl-2-thiouridylate)-methyltransferase [Gammaproteobacteria bacterium]|nr:tRNA (5-methylaminomethyl-2-thiouridylate)-methyltransferase [Gammaproteobacteria bacterium]
MNSSPAFKPRAVALISGGLDSMLAAKIVQAQGIYVEGVNFFTGFCVEGHTQAVNSPKKAKPKRHSALWSAEQIGIPMQIVDISEDYKDVVINPTHGYGRLLNPCLDCKIFMVNHALDLVGNDGKPFDFVITGEVIGQRPKSQRAQTMPLIAKESGAHDRLLRPLSAKHLPTTLPEREGWVDPDKLYGFSGRSRKPQIELAKSLGITEWSQPAGGCCFLTDESYTKKLRDLWAARGKRDYDIEDVVLLKIGRHIRPAPHYKLIVGRREGENRFLHGFRHKFQHLTTLSHEGPLCLVDGDLSHAERRNAASIVARYSRGREAAEVMVRYTDLTGVSEEFAIQPMAPHELPAAWLLTN